MRIKKGAQDLIIYVILYVQSECRDMIGRKRPIVFDFRNLWHVATLNAFLCVQTHAYFLKSSLQNTPRIFNDLADIIHLLFKFLKLCPVTARCHSNMMLQIKNVRVSQHKTTCSWSWSLGWSRSLSVSLCFSCKKKLWLLSENYCSSSLVVMLLFLLSSCTLAGSLWFSGVFHPKGWTWI